MLIQLNTIEVTFYGQRLRSKFTLKNESKVGNTSYRAVQENADGNDSVPISLCRGECCCSSWLFLEFFVLKLSARPRVGFFWFLCEFRTSRLSKCAILMIVQLTSTW